PRTVARPGDGAKSGRAWLVYGSRAVGWRNSAQHWHRYESAYLILAGLCTPLVISVHSVVSSDFAMALTPGWHETVFPPYFVAGAILSGFAMVILLAVPLRRLYGLESFITIEHLDVMAKVLLATSLLTAYGYLSEQFHSWYGGEPAEETVYRFRLFGPAAPLTWTLYFCNVFAPQSLWWRGVRRRPWALVFIALLVLVGMWLERYVIITTSLSRDFLPSSWGRFRPTIWDILTFVGSIGLFGCLFLLFVRLLPMISIAEMRGLLPETRAREEGRHDSA